MSALSFFDEIFSSPVSDEISLKIWANGRRIRRVAENVYAAGDDITNCNDNTIECILRHQNVTGNIDEGFVFL